MILKWDHLASRRISWTDKVSSIVALSQELNISTDSIAFLDDNEVECARVRAGLPEVFTIRVGSPAASDDLFDHLWPFDISDTDHLGAERTIFFQVQRKREQLRHSSTSLADFLTSLDLRVEMRAAEPKDFPRVIELTHRTTQFNAMTVPMHVERLRKYIDESSRYLLVVSASDRFGDYGTIGFASLRYASELIVEMLLLSCRVLGKGIEHEVLGFIGRLACEVGLSSVSILVLGTKRNLPVREFLLRLRPQRTSHDENIECWSFSAKQLAETRYAPEGGMPQSITFPQDHSPPSTPESEVIWLRRTLETIADRGRKISLKAFRENSREEDL